MGKGLTQKFEALQMGLEGCTRVFWLVESFCRLKNRVRKGYSVGWEIEKEKTRYRPEKLPKGQKPQSIDRENQQHSALEA